jgi:hypothetical protein
MNIQQELRDRALRDLTRKGLEWSRTLPKVRDYFNLLQRLDTIIPTGFKSEQYGSVTYDGRSYPLMRVISENWSNDKPTLVISAGVHGSEPAGVEAALTCIRDLFPQYTAQFNLAAYPCLNPSGYEIDSRWNFLGQDLNRNFGEQAAEEVEECRLFTASVMGLAVSRPIDDLIDMHENLRVGVPEMQRQAALTNTMSNWDNLAPGYFIYECVLGKDVRIGPQIIQAVSAVMPICPQTEIAGDAMQNGVSYWPQDTYEASDYTGATSTDSHLLVMRHLRHGFTFESPEIWIKDDGEVQEFTIDQRALAHVTGARAVLDSRLGSYLQQTPTPKNNL